MIVTKEPTTTACEEQKLRDANLIVRNGSHIIVDLASSGQLKEAEDVSNRITAILRVIGHRTPTQCKFDDTPSYKFN